MIAKNLFTAIYSEYLVLTNPIPERTALRNRIDALRTRGFDGKTGSHKLFVHLQTLHRLGFVERAPDTNERHYVVTEDGQNRIEKLLEAIPNALALEELVKEHRSIETASLVYGVASVRPTLTPHDALLYLLPRYQQIVQTGVAICPIAPLIEATQILLLTEQSKFVSYSEFLSLLHKLQGIHIREVRFHQDRRGNVAFLKLSEHLVQKTLEENPNIK